MFSRSSRSTMIPKKGASQVLREILQGNSGDLSTCMKRRKAIKYLMHPAASSFVCHSVRRLNTAFSSVDLSHDLHFCWSDGAADHHIRRAATLDALTWVFGLLQKKGASSLQHVGQEPFTLHGSGRTSSIFLAVLCPVGMRERIKRRYGFFDVSQMSPNGGCLSLFLATQFHESHVVSIVLRRRDCQDSHVENAFSDVCEELLPASHGKPTVIELEPFFLRVWAWMTLLFAQYSHLVFSDRAFET